MNGQRKAVESQSVLVSGVGGARALLVPVQTCNKAGLLYMAWPSSLALVHSSLQETAGNRIFNVLLFSEHPFLKPIKYPFYRLRRHVVQK